LRKAAQKNIKKGKRTRSLIHQTAYRLFQEQGYHGTSMRQIAESAGIALGSIYNHFKSKEDIFLAVLEAYHPYHEILPLLKNAQGETVESFVQNAAESMIVALEKRPFFLNLMLIEIVEFKSKHIPHMFNLFFPQVISVVQRFAEQQDNLRQVPLPIIVRTFIGLFLSYYLIESLLKEELPEELQDDPMKHAVDIFLHGILSEEGSS
jgi:AcrR family transcriptional regulator